MAHNTRVRSNLTAWGSGAILDTELDQLDQGQFQSINGDAGGVWAPAIPIIIGGAGFKVTGTFTSTGSAIFAGDEVLVESGAFVFVTPEPEFRNGLHVSTGTATFDDNAVFNDVTEFFANTIVHSGGYFHALGDAQLGSNSSNTLTINATADFVAPATFDSTITLNGALTANGTADFHQDVTIWSAAELRVRGSSSYGSTSSDTFGVNASATFNAVAEFWGQLTVHSGAPFHALGDSQLGTSSSNSADVKATMTLHEALAFTGNGRVPGRAVIGADVASRTYRVSDANFVYIDVLSQNSTYVLSDEGVVEGDSVTFYTTNPSYNVLVQPTGATGVNLKVLPGNTQGSEMVTYKYISGRWREIRPIPPGFTG